MKKTSALILLAAMLISLVACKEDNAKKPNASSSGNSLVSSLDESSSKPGDSSDLESEGDNTSDSQDNNPTQQDNNYNVTDNKTNATPTNQSNNESNSNDTQKDNEQSKDNGLPETFERSWHFNAGSVAYPVIGEYDDEADEIRKDILNNTEQSVKITGTTYYVSNNGNDANDGKSPNTALATLSGVGSKSGEIKSGDAVLFERGGIFRGSLFLKDGVYYGAYGKGVKPCVYGSRRNYVNSSWVNEGNNIWRLSTTFTGDVGNIVFNHGEAVAYLRTSKSELKQNYDFFSDRENSNKVYLYLDKDPTKLFKSIEICEDGRIFDFDNHKNITIENITFKYTGGHAIRGANTSNITVRYCEIGYIGGSYLNGYSDGNTRYGNGVELMGSSKNTLVENCLIYQIYDSGITHQGDNCTVENFVAKNNLIEYCGMGAIEYWHTNGAYMKNIHYVGNMLRFSGYGFGGMQRVDKHMTACIMSNAKSSGSTYNKAENFVIENNIFELSTYQLLNLGSAAGTPPKLKGNTYCNVYGRYMGYYKDTKNIRFNSELYDVLIDVWGDPEPTVIAK